MQHEPRRLLSGAECPSEFVRRDAVLGVGDEPDSGEPLVESERRVLEDRAELDRELLFTALALPESASRQVGVFNRATAGANGPVRPAQLGDEIGADVDVREVADCLNEGAGK